MAIQTAAFVEHTDRQMNNLRDQKKILLLLDKQRDRELLGSSLNGQFQVQTEIDDSSELNVDIAIIDDPMLRRHKSYLQSLKDRAAPVFLPMLLLVNDSATLSGSQGVWDFADDVLSIPVPRDVLKARIKVLLRTRGYALDLHDRNRQLEEARRRWEYLVQKDPDLVQITIDGHIQFINPAGARIFGATRPEEILGRSIFDFIIEEHHEKTHQRKELLEAGNVALPTINKIRTLNGEIRYLQVQSMPIQYQEKQAVQTVGQDFTNIVEYEQLLERSIEEKNTLMQEIHHRVKNNLAIISGLLEMQAMDTEDLKLQDILNKNKMRIFSIAKVHELLYQHGNLNRIQFDGYIEELTEAISSTFRGQEIDISFDLRLDMVLLNIHQAVPCGMVINELLTNSVKHAFEGKNAGKIRIEMLEKEDRVFIRISDDGVGFPESFDLSKQKSMGATIIRLLVQQLGADFDYKTKDGARFNFSFEKSAYTGPAGE